MIKKQKIYLWGGIIAVLCIGSVSLGVWGLSNRNNIELSEVVQFQTGGAARVIDIVGDYAYILDYDDSDPQGLVIIDISDPTHPEKISSLYSGGLAIELAISDNFLYLANMLLGLQLVNVSDPLHPILVDYVSPYESVTDVVIQGNTLYLGAWNDDVVLLDITSPAIPQEISSCPLLGVASKLYVSGDLVYAIDHRSDDSGLRIFNCSNQNSPQELGSKFITGVDLWIPVVKDNILYAPDHGGSGDLMILDVADASSIQVIGTYDTLGTLDRCQFIGENLYLVDYERGIIVLDVSNPETPKKIGFYTDSSHMRDFAVLAEFLFVADEGDGLVVLQIE